MFFDLEEMSRDNFNTQLLNYIEGAKDVFILLENGSLDACKRDDWEEDWFCKEVAYALKFNKNIIPILIGDYKMPKQEFLPDKLQELSLKNAPEFSFSYFEEYLNKLIEKGYITAEAKVKNQAASIFKFYSDEDCDIHKEGKLVCHVEGMSDEPFYLHVPRKGEYRFKCSFSDKKKILIDSYIDSDEEKIIHIKRQKVGNRTYMLYALCCMLFLLNVFALGFIVTRNYRSPQIDTNYVVQSRNKGQNSRTIEEVDIVKELIDDENIPSTVQYTD